MNEERKTWNKCPLVSIVVPAYNVAAYLEECIQSLLKQTYKNIEIIIVDDGSTDKTGEICDSFSCSNVQVIHKENGGLSSARNAGIRRAAGEYIAFVDSDDYVASEYVQTMLELIEENNGDIAVCGFVRTGKRLGEMIQETAEETKNSSEETTDNLTWVLSGKEALNQLYSPKRLYYVVSWNKLYRTSMFADIAFPEGMLHEDEAVIHKLYHAAKKVVFTRKPLYYYYMSDSSIMRGTYKVERMGILYTYLERMKMFSRDGNAVMKDNSCKQCMVAALMHYYFCKKDKKISQEKAEECLCIFHKCKASVKTAAYISWKYKLFFKWASFCPYLAGKLVDIKVNRFYHGE